MPLRINYESGQMEWIEMSTQAQIDGLMEYIKPTQYPAGVGKAILIGSSIGDNGFEHFWEESNTIRYMPIPIIPKKRKSGLNRYFAPAWNMDILLGKEMYEGVKANRNHPLHMFLRKPPLPPDWPPTRTTEEKMKEIFNEIYNCRKA